MTQIQAIIFLVLLLYFLKQIDHLHISIYYLIEHRRLKRAILHRVVPFIILFFSFANLLCLSENRQFPMNLASVLLEKIYFLRIHLDDL